MQLGLSAVLVQNLLTNKAKRAKALTLMPQAAYCRGAGSHRQSRHTAYARSRGLWPAAIQPHVVPVCRFDDLNPHNMDIYTLTDLRWMEGWVQWVGLVGWPIVDSLLAWWSTGNHRSGCRGEKVHRPKTDILTTEPRCQAQWKLQLEILMHVKNHPTHHEICEAHLDVVRSENDPAADGKSKVEHKRTHQEPQNIRRGALDRPNQNLHPNNTNIKN